MMFIALFSLISVAFAAPELLGTKECTYGPSYWCSHISRAQKCGAVQHCMATVWKNQIIKPKGTQECKLCMMGIKVAKEMLKDKKTEEEIEKYLPKVCDFISDATTKAECTKDMTEYLPVILNLLKSDMTAAQICATIKLCSGFEDTVPHHEVKTQDVKVNTDKVCQDCTNFFTDLQNMITSNETVNQIENELKQTVCAQLGPIQGVCDFVVEEYVPQLIMYAGQAVNPPTTCRVIGFCNNNGDIYTAMNVRMQFMKMLKELKKKSVAGQEECDACKSIMADLQSLDRDPTAQGKVTSFVKTYICGKLSGLQDECANLVDTYAPILFGLLANELDPETTCTFLGLCTSSAVKSKKQPIKAMSLVPAMPVKKVKPVKTSGEFCAVCKLAMNFLDKEIVANKTQKEIEDILDNICTRLPGDLPAQCSAFVNQYLPAILKLLKEEAAPDTICDKLGLCTPLKSQKKIEATKKANSEQCVICEFVMDKVESLLQKNATQAEIESVLEKVCGIMPATIKDECDDFVKQYSPLIIKLLAGEITPKQICTKIGLCTSAIRVLPKPAVTGILLRGEPIINQRMPVKNAELCVVCEMVLNYVSEALKENKTEAAIKSLLEKACNALPKSMSQECQGIIIAFGDMIIQEIINEVDPKEICTLIEVCPGAKISKGQMKTSMKNVLKNALTKPKKTQDSKLYFKSTQKLGQRKCSYGPSYWCDSLKNAKRCGMEEHCRIHVWSRN